MSKYGKVNRFWDYETSSRHPLPEGIYRGGMTEKDFVGFDDKLKQSYSLNNASPSEMHKARYEACKHRFGNGQYDSGSAAMQAAVFCEKTISMVQHLQNNHKDSGAVRRLLILLTRRRKALLYLKRKNFVKYSQVIHYYGIKDIDVGLHKSHFHCKHMYYRYSSKKKINHKF